MSSTAGLPRPRRPPLLTATFVLVVTALGVLQCRAWNGAPNADGISYLELAHQYAHGRLDAVANGYWSPLYPALLGLALRLSGAPSLHYADGLAPELKVALAVNLLVLAVATFCFARLVLTLEDAEAPSSRPIRVCRAIAAAALWIWCSIRLIGATTITPDLLLGAWLLLATSESVRLTREPLSRARGVRLSVILGLGYWTKAVFFPLVLVGGATGLILARRTRCGEGGPWLGWGVVAVCAPLVVLQSATQRHPTFGETGRLNYQWYVNEMPRMEPNSESLEVGKAGSIGDIVYLPSGSLLLKGNVPGSFPYWYDPTRFTSRRPIKFSFNAQWRAARANLYWYRVVAGTLCLLCLAAAAAATTRQRVDWTRLIVALPVLTLLTLHALTHPEGRLVGAGLATLLVLLLYPGGERRVEVRSGALVRVGECAALLALVVIALGRASNRVSFDRQTVVDNLAGELVRHGLRAGDQVGMLGSPYGHYWAHEAGLRIVLVGDDRTASDSFPNTPRMISQIHEACARGISISALLWRDDREPIATGVVGLQGGWKVWKAGRICGDTTIAAR